MASVSNIFVFAPGPIEEPLSVDGLGRYAAVLALPSGMVTAVARGHGPLGDSACHVPSRAADHHGTIALLRRIMTSHNAKWPK